MILTEQKTAKFHIGQIVECLTEGSRGVIVDVDPEFVGDVEWLAENAQERMVCIEDPWYHVAIDEYGPIAYMAQTELLEADDTMPLFNEFLDLLPMQFEQGRYWFSQAPN